MLKMRHLAAGNITGHKFIRKFLQIGVRMVLTMVTIRGDNPGISLNQFDDCERKGSSTNFPEMWPLVKEWFCESSKSIGT